MNILCHFHMTFPSFACTGKFHLADSCTICSGVRQSPQMQVPNLLAHPMGSRSIVGRRTVASRRLHSEAPMTRFVLHIWKCKPFNSATLISDFKNMKTYIKMQYFYSFPFLSGRIGLGLFSLLFPGWTSIARRLPGTAALFRCDEAGSAGARDQNLA
jgi:hypothetical protein